MNASLLDLEEMRFQAICRADVEHLEQAFHDQLVYAHTSGNVESKKQFIEVLADGRRKYSQFDVLEASVRHDGSMAVTHGVAKCMLVSKGVTKDLKIRYLSCMVFEDSRWQLVNWQSTIIP
jgi:hypothetical protein